MIEALHTGRQEYAFSTAGVAAMSFRVCTINFQGFGSPSDLRILRSSGRHHHQQQMLPKFEIRGLIRNLRQTNVRRARTELVEVVTLLLCVEAQRPLGLRHCKLRAVSHRNDVEISDGVASFDPDHAT
jgi:hypothetical protein